MGPIAKAFVVVNRVVGWGVAVAGASFLLGAVQTFFDSRASWSVAGWNVLIGVTLMAVGVVYIWAPLSRSKSGSDRG
jgi:hypothetical protein